MHRHTDTQQMVITLVSTRFTENCGLKKRCSVFVRSSVSLSLFSQHFRPVIALTLPGTGTFLRTSVASSPQNPTGDGCSIHSGSIVAVQGFLLNSSWGTYVTSWLCRLLMFSRFTIRVFLLFRCLVLVLYFHLVLFIQIEHTGKTFPLNCLDRFGHFSFHQRRWSRASVSQGSTNVIRFSHCKPLV